MYKKMVAAVITIITILSVISIQAFAVDVSLMLSAEEAKPGDLLTASGAAGAGEWVSVKIVDMQGDIVFFDAVKSDLNGDYNITFGVPEVQNQKMTVVAGYGANTAAAEFYVVGESQNNPPVLENIGNKTVDEGKTLTFTVNATDEDEGDILTYSAGNLPSGAVFDAAVRQFRWTPGKSQSGKYTGIRFSVSDGKETDYEDVTITVKNVPSSNGNSGNKNRDTGISATPEPEYPEGTKKITVPVPVMDNEGRRAVVVIDPVELIKSMETNSNIIVEVPKADGANGYSLNIPPEAVTSGEEDKHITIITQIGTLEISSGMMNTNDFSGVKEISLDISAVNKDELDEEIKQRIGDRPVIKLEVRADRKTVAWENPEAPVSVSIPYTPSEEELSDPEHIVAWYIDGSGNIVSVPSGHYDPESGTVTFTTTHFSQYAVAYVIKTFDDLESAAGAKKQIEVLASRGIVRGISENQYCPDTSITRADFLYSLVRTLDLDARVDGNFDDISSDDYFYREISVAKKLGITFGTGNNKFSPDESITRQDMMALTERALLILKKLERNGTSSDLDRFDDKSLIASYAVDSAASLINEGLIMCGGDKINPLGNTTRAEAAVLLYKIYNNYFRLSK